MAVVEGDGPAHLGGIAGTDGRGVTAVQVRVDETG